MKAPVNNHQKVSSSNLASLLLIPWLLLPACEDSDQPVAGSPDAAGDVGGLPDADAAPAPVYALTTQIFGAEGSETQSYVLLTSELTGRLRIEEAVVQIPGRALGTGPDQGGLLYLASDGGPTVTRYQLGGDRALVKQETISFLGQGVSSFGEYGGQFQFVAADKAYWFDAQTAKIVVWNPAAMTVTGTVPLSELAFAGEGLSFTAAPLRVGTVLYSFAGWRKGPVPITVSSRAAVVALDTTTDRATVVTDGRCGYVRDGVLAADGFIYLATETLGASVNFLNPQNGPPPCLLRFDPRTGAFDPGFQVDLRTLFGGAAAGSLVVAASGRTFLRFMDQALLPADPASPVNTNPRALSSAPVWKWAHLSLGDVPAATPLATPPATGSVLPLRLGAATYAPLFSGQVETTLAELTDEGLGTATASVPGLVFSAVRLR